MALFEVLDPHGAAVAPPGPWQARPAPAASFSVGTASATVWRANLPADPELARSELMLAEAGLRLQEDAVAAAPARIEALVRGAASFGAAPLAAPERELLGVLGSASGNRGGAASFGLRETTSELWETAETRFRAFAAQAQDAITKLAVVETRVEGRLIARTSVNWTGDLRSLLSTPLAAEQAALHQRTLTLATRSRMATLRTFGTVLRGAAIVATMASSPVGAITALPAAWSFVEQLLSDMRSPAEAAP